MMRCEKKKEDTTKTFFILSNTSFISNITDMISKGPASVKTNTLDTWQGSGAYIIKGLNKKEGENNEIIITKK